MADDLHNEVGAVANLHDGLWLVNFSFLIHHWLSYHLFLLPGEDGVGAPWLHEAPDEANLVRLDLK